MRAGMAKLERLLVGSGSVHEEPANETFLTDNEVATKAEGAETAAIQ
jgi:hypothetical protein